MSNGMDMTRGNDTLQNDSYVFNAQTGNLTSRALTGRSAETFTYDNLDRLTQISSGNQGSMTMTYSQNGNISTKNNMGQYSYSSTSMPHAVSSISPVEGIPEYEQYIEYNPWNKAEDIYHEEGDDYYYYHIEYGPDQQRVRSSMYKNDILQYKKLYWDSYEEYLYENGNSDITVWSYWIEAPDGLAGFYWNSSDEYYLAIHPCVAMTDHLGSLTGLYDHNGYKTLDATYDAWGKRTFAAGSMQMDRGFTGHEHIDALGLINMNGRMYDPLQGRFLSPDNYIQAPDNPQNYNRYSYCLNNPLKYTDPDGEFWHLIIGGIIGGMTNWISHDCEFSWKGFWYFNVGALAGAACAAVGGGVSSSLAGSSFWAGAAGTSSAMTAGSSFLHGVAIGGSSGFSSGFIAGTGNSIISGANFSNALLNGLNEGLTEGAIAALCGGIYGGIKAARDGRRFLDGATVEKYIVDQSAFVTPSGQGGLVDCGPESVEIVDRSFGGNITAEDIRRELGGDINKDALGDASTWDKYKELSNHRWLPERSEFGRSSRIVSGMRDGARVAVNLNTGYINPSTGLAEGHSVVMQKATHKIITHLNGEVSHRFIFKAVNPGYSGGKIERITMDQIKNAHNIFYIY